ncbi:hypothetical protein M1N19_00185 [Dehalococcoidia bacterium]|nr:hypothetical protein [Dehalococcoidia bacterium]
MERQAAHRFTPSAWKSLRLSHNHLDNCSAVTHIPTRLIITDSIGQRTKIIQLWDKAQICEACLRRVILLGKGKIAEEPRFFVV